MKKVKDKKARKKYVEVTSRFTLESIRALKRLQKKTGVKNIGEVLQISTAYYEKDVNLTAKGGWVINLKPNGELILMRFPLPKTKF